MVLNLLIIMSLLIRVELNLKNKLKLIFIKLRIARCYLNLIDQSKCLYSCLLKELEKQTFGGLIWSPCEEVFWLLGRSSKINHMDVNVVHLSNFSIAFYLCALG